MEHLQVGIPAQASSAESGINNIALTSVEFGDFNVPPFGQLRNACPARVDELLRNLREIPEFNQTLISANQPIHLWFMDGVYKSQVEYEYVYRVVVEGIPEELALAEAIENRPKVVNRWAKCKDLHVISTYGSARDHVWTDSLENCINLIADYAVAQHIGNSNGGAISGVMGRATLAWIAAIESFQLQNEGEKTLADVANVRLKFLGTTTEPPNELVRGKGLQPPPQMTFATRTPLLHTMGNNLLHLYFPGGLGTQEEVFVDLLGQQMAPHSLTLYSNRSPASMPRIVLLDPNLDEFKETRADCSLSKAGSFFAGTRLQLESMLITRAVSDADLERIYLIGSGGMTRFEKGKLIVDSAIRLDDPHSVGQFVIENALERNRALKREEEMRVNNVV